MPDFGGSKPQETQESSRNPTAVHPTSPKETEQLLFICESKVSNLDIPNDTAIKVSKSMGKLKRNSLIGQNNTESSPYGAKTRAKSCMRQRNRIGVNFTQQEVSCDGQADKVYDWKLSQQRPHTQSRSSNLSRIYSSYNARPGKQASLANAFHKPTKPSVPRIVTKACGIDAIDEYFKSVNFKAEVQANVDRSDFLRLVRLVKYHLTANRFPKCEVEVADAMIGQLLQQASSKQKMQVVIKRLEDYLA